MQIGDTVYRHPMTSAPGRVYPAKVVYIHPRRRFYEVEFEFHRGDDVQGFRQSYYFRSRQGDPEMFKRSCKE